MFYVEITPVIILKGLKKVEYTFKIKIPHSVYKCKVTKIYMLVRILSEYCTENDVNLQKYFLKRYTFIKTPAKVALIFENFYNDPIRTFIIIQYLSLKERLILFMHFMLLCIYPFPKFSLNKKSKSTKYF